MNIGPRGAKRLGKGKKKPKNLVGLTKDKLMYNMYKGGGSCGGNRLKELKDVILSTLERGPTCRNHVQFNTLVLHTTT